MRGAGTTFKRNASNHVEPGLPDWRPLMAANKKNAKTSAKKAPAKSAQKSTKKAVRKAAPKINAGAVAHTEFASSDPAATKKWAQKAFGWKFMPAMPTPGGDYHMTEMGEGNSAGMRSNMAPEMPGTIVYVEVANIKRGYEKALKSGASAMMPPMPIGNDMGSMAIVNAPGGVAIGLWSQK